MRQRLSVVLVVVFAIASSARAGITYRFTTKITGNPINRGASGRVFIDGDRYRIELDPDSSNPRPFDVTIFDGGETRFVNVGIKTWYREKALPTKDSREKIEGKTKVEHTLEGNERVAGRDAAKHVVTISYKISSDYGGGTKLRTIVSTTMILWIDPSLPSIPVQHAFVTGHDAVDRALAPVLKELAGLPLRSVHSVTRRIEGGYPRTIVSETEITGIEQVEVPPSTFVVPASFREQEPVYGSPG